MLHLIPNVKSLEIKEGFLKNNEICYKNLVCDERVLAAEGICLMAELLEKMEGIQAERSIDTQAWVDAYFQRWLQNNKPCELYRITDMFTWIEGARL